MGNKTCNDSVKLVERYNPRPTQPTKNRRKKDTNTFSSHFLFFFLAYFSRGLVVGWPWVVKLVDVNTMYFVLHFFPTQQSLEITNTLIPVLMESRYLGKRLSFRRSQPNLAGTVVYGRSNFLVLYFGTFQFSAKKWIYGGDIRQHLLEKFQSRSWIRRGVILCAHHTSFDEIIDSNVNSERRQLVRGSDPPLVYSTHTTVGDVWRRRPGFC